MTNYARIARNDDETFSDEAEFVARRRTELAWKWMGDKAKVTEAIAEAMSDDGEDFFAGLMASFMIGWDGAQSRPAALEAGRDLWKSLGKVVFDRLERDAETAAQAEWDSRLTGPEGDL